MEATLGLYRTLWSNRAAIKAQPDKTGFGTKLSQSTVVGQFEGTIAYDLNPAGLSVVMSLPTANLSH